ncbi:EF-hand domain-containing protein [Streptomyces sp. NPDC091371]|uniref:EF-hand domain-containing protein n=1 Tax=Streptomyces sp. NPDC091371 TaxID=3155303 RepID=UPI0034153C0B
MRRHKWARNRCRSNCSRSSGRRFSTFDKNGTGSISAADLMAVMQSRGMAPTESEVRDMVSEFDQNANGVIEFPEFLAVMARRLADANSDDDEREAFRVFDKDRDGLIDADELHRVMTNIGEPLTKQEAEEMLKDADGDGDGDGDGKINYEEFGKMISHNA